MSPAQENWLKEVQRCQNHIISQISTIDLLSQQIADSLLGEGVLHVFGSGHSHIIAEEMFHRAGGLVPVNAILEPYLMPHSGPSRVGTLERNPGVAAGILKAHEFREGEFLLISSNSGINAVSVEMATDAKKFGLKTVAVTSLEHSKATPSRAGQKKLYELCDYVIDTGTPVGDACLSFEGLDVKVCPLSGTINLFFAQLLVASIVESFEKRGKQAPVYKSANTPGGDEYNHSLEKKYRSRIQHLL